MSWNQCDICFAQDPDPCIPERHRQHEASQAAEILERQARGTEERLEGLTRLLIKSQDSELKALKIMASLQEDVAELTVHVGELAQAVRSLAKGSRE